MKDSNASLRGLTPPRRFASTLPLQGRVKATYAARMLAMKRSSSARRRVLSLDSVRAEFSTSSEADPVSVAPRLTCMMLAAASLVPCATFWTLRAISCVAVPCCSTAVEQQSAATQEIARSVQNVAKGTDDAAADIIEVNRGATETGSASEEVLNSARTLSTESTRLRAELDRFMANIRAA